MHYCRLYAFGNKYNALKVLKLHGTSTEYIIRKEIREPDITLVYSDDAIHTKGSSQFFFTVGLMICEVWKGTPFHLVSWSSQRPHRPS